MNLIRKYKLHLLGYQNFEDIDLIFMSQFFDLEKVTFKKYPDDVFYIKSDKNYYIKLIFKINVKDKLISIDESILNKIDEYCGKSNTYDFIKITIGSKIENFTEYVIEKYPWYKSMIEKYYSKEYKYRYYKYRKIYKEHQYPLFYPKKNKT